MDQLQKGLGNALAMRDGLGRLIPPAGSMSVGLTAGEVSPE